MFGIAGTVELGTICPGTGTWNRLQDGMNGGSTHAISSGLLLVLRIQSGKQKSRRPGIRHNIRCFDMALTLLQSSRH